MTVGKDKVTYKIDMIASQEDEFKDMTAIWDTRWHPQEIWQLVKKMNSKDMTASKDKVTYTREMTDNQEDEFKGYYS